MKRATKRDAGPNVPTGAELNGKLALKCYVDQKWGTQRRLADATGIDVATLSKMVNRPEYVITLDAAMRIELATEGELTTEVLCPSRAELFTDILFMRLNR